MSQNRNKIIDIFVGNISNCIVHKILEKAIDEENIRKHYDREFLTSLEVAKRYREKINPRGILPDKDISEIKEKIRNKVDKELRLRVSKGYKNINLGLVEEIIDEILIKMKVK